VAIKTIATNPKAYHEYFIDGGEEAGLVLTGSEIKSIRAGHVSIRESYVRPIDGELWLIGAHISQYDPASYMGHDPIRSRKLLMHRKQINLFMSNTKVKGLTLVATKLYLKDGKAKVEVALGRGKKLYDKRDAIAKADIQREMGRALRRKV